MSVIEMHVSEPGFNVVKSFEGRSLRAYKDVVGVWTIGFGNTNSDASVLGFTIKAGVTITAEQAELLLRVAMKQRYEPTVRKKLPTANQAQFDAGASFAYNCGTGALSTCTWVKDFNAGRGAKAILLWNKGDGKVLAGLTRRRKRELSMIEVSDYGPEGRNPPPVLNAAGRVVAGSTVPVPAGAVTVPPGVVETVNDKAGVPNNATPAPVSIGMLRFGDQGEEVREVQRQLIAAGFPCNANGSYDQQTVKAMTAFQKSHKQLDVDGIAGPASRAALQRTADLKSKSKRGAGAGVAGATAATADQTSHAAPFLPTWSLWAMGLTFAAIGGYVFWQYRDELTVWVKSKFA